jgi:Domain of unknown function (DUF4124)
MKTRSLLAMLVIAVIANGSLMAQSPQEPRKKLYRWVDKNGKTQVSDTLPPELAGQARKELNASGTPSSTVARALTEEERTQKALEDEQKANADKAVAEQKRLEAAMLASYQSEEELQRIYKERTDLLQQTIESTDISIKSIRGSLATMLSQASEDELKKRSVEEDKIKSMQSLHAELLKQQASQIGRKEDIKSLQNEYQKVLARFRELRTAEDASATANLPTATTPTTAPAATPSK